MHRFPLVNSRWIINNLATDLLGFITFVSNIEDGLENDTLQRNMSIEIEGNSFDEDFQDLKNRLEVSFGSRIQLDVQFIITLKSPLCVASTYKNNVQHCSRYLKFYETVNAISDFSWRSFYGIYKIT